ncbi:MAG: hypothetical protein A2W25_09985 [candidate division Zixibacteria bacterium RBG_16_53_22]|nr:MAG: hypothetical protein A2W25_09985 [candidate division Zixibacteria bacterium RBG_16_53_22]
MFTPSVELKEAWKNFQECLERLDEKSFANVLTGTTTRTDCLIGTATRLIVLYVRESSFQDSLDKDLEQIKAMIDGIRPFVKFNS